MTEGTVSGPIIEQRYRHSAHLGHPRRRDMASCSAFAAFFRESTEPVPGPRRLARSCGISDDRGVGVVLILVVFGAAIWWQAKRKRWGAVRTLVFWLVALAVLWVLASRYNAGASPGLG
jgi:hypothetical protein